MAENSDIVWSGLGTEDIECQISRKQWQVHVVKRPEIEEALELTKVAMAAPEVSEPDRRRPADESERSFRLLRIAGQGQWARHIFVVSVKYVRQSNGRWIKFY